MNDNINDYVPSIINPRKIKKCFGDLSLTQNSVVSYRSLSLKKNGAVSQLLQTANKENVYNQNRIGVLRRDFKTFNNVEIKSLASTKILSQNYEINSFRLSDINGSVASKSLDETILFDNGVINKDVDTSDKASIITVSSNTEILNFSHHRENNYDSISIISVEFAIQDCDKLNISTKSSFIRNINLEHKNNNITVSCQLVENSKLSIESDSNENMNETLLKPPLKRSGVAVSLEIQRKRLSKSEDATENSSILILNSDAIDKVSHVIVQPPNFKLVKQTNLNKGKITDRRNSVGSPLKNGKIYSHKHNRNQKLIETYFRKNNNVLESKTKNESSEVKSLHNDIFNTCQTVKSLRNDAREMNKNLGISDANKIEKSTRGAHKSNWKDNEQTPKSAKHSRRSNDSPKRDVKVTSSEIPRNSSPKGKDSVGNSPRKPQESVPYSTSPKSKSNKTTVSSKNVPHFKIIAGTHFAVDAFSYGEIPNVKHYFLTHFHSDHYSGLKKSFNKLLFCSKITADLCVSRLGVNPKCIHIINTNETILIEGVEVTPVDANHCPGALMLVFTLPNGKTVLHTGDFRASPAMESYPIFWNKDIHTVYLDTTYCNPRYDFPTQDQSIEMALHLLRQKKIALEESGKKFSSVLIVCGTYTIGKEKFFLGMARRVGCGVWACPEKDRVLQAVEGRSFSEAAPHACQLHVVPMRDLTHEKLRSYLDSLQGAFNEVVAFKPSGWENGKNTTAIEKDMVTIHGIPYSEHSSFSEIIRFVKYLKPKQVVPTVDISGGVKAVQKYFPCPLVCKDDIQCQSKMTDYFSIQNRQQVPAVT